MQTTIRLHSLPFSSPATYFVALAFIAGNILLPQLVHLIPQGGIIWLPIYFFTLVGTYKYGWRVGLLTAIVSPVVNSLLFGMPHAAALPAILLKSSLLAVAAGYAASHFKKASLALLALVGHRGQRWRLYQKFPLTAGSDPHRAGCGPFPLIKDIVG